MTSEPLMAGTRQAAQATKYVVAYAKVVDDKREGIYIQGVYFGGVGNTPTEADSIARECVNSCRGGTIIPKVIPSPSKDTILQALRTASQQFSMMEHQMLQAEEIYNRNNK